ncbi:hypothetical protein B0H11DRAFT_2258359 [Mycena galericulata]|nr:hypothetical protein B0H11DRAFT_2258359 [Mycena galericulata]
MWLNLGRARGRGFGYWVRALGALDGPCTKRAPPFKTGNLFTLIIIALSRFLPPLSLLPLLLCASSAPDSRRVDTWTLHPQAAMFLTGVWNFYGPLEPFTWCRLAGSFSRPAARCALPAYLVRPRALFECAPVPHASYTANPLDFYALPPRAVRAHVRDTLGSLRKCLTPPMADVLARWLRRIPPVDPLCAAPPTPPRLNALPRPACLRRPRPQAEIACPSLISGRLCATLPLSMLPSPLVTPLRPLFCPLVALPRPFVALPRPLVTPPRGPRPLIAPKCLLVAPPCLAAVRQSRSLPTRRTIAVRHRVSGPALPSPRPGTHIPE